MEKKATIRNARIIVNIVGFIRKNTIMSTAKKTNGSSSKSK